MPYTDREEKSEEQKRAGKFLTQKQRHNLIVELAVIIILAGLIVAFGVALLTH